ncbi:MAG: hypothetical protein NTV58_14515 [Deltaproteobacteria bacterium]|nr:hypothetical protein [Deltaproteobacteria bacterium]
MSMKLRSLNGELVYLEDLWALQDVDGDFKCFTGQTQAVKQSVIIDILNELFSKAAATPDEVPDELRRLIYEMGSYFKRKKYNMQVEILDALDVRLRHCKAVNAKTHTKTKKLGKVPLQLAAPQWEGANQQTPKITNDHLTGEFRAFLAKEREGVEVTT